MQQVSIPESMAKRVPEKRYAYYRRCHEFRKNGEQCKAPAEKGSQICYAHAGQRAMALRREGERRAVLAEAVAEMRRRGRQKFEMADLLTDFKGIQATLAMTARAVIDGRIDCKTAGRLLVQLQMASKLLWMAHREGTSTTEARRHGEKPTIPQIYIDERKPVKGLTTASTRSTPLSQATCRAAKREKVLELTVEVSAKRHQ